MLGQSIEPHLRTFSSPLLQCNLPLPLKDRHPIRLAYDRQASDAKLNRPQEPSCVTHAWDEYLYWLKHDYVVVDRSP